MPAKSSQVKDFDWIIFYSDGTTISNHDKSPFELDGDKERGTVQVIIQPGDTPRDPWVALCGVHNYVWKDIGNGHKWVGVNDFGLYQYLLQAGPKAVVFGETISNERFFELFREAENMCGVKNTFKRWERKP